MLNRILNTKYRNTVGIILNPVYNTRHFTGDLLGKRALQLFSFFFNEIYLTKNLAFLHLVKRIKRTEIERKKKGYI